MRKAKASKAKKKTVRIDLVTEKRAKAYRDMEPPYVCDIVRMGQIASMLFDNPDGGLFSRYLSVHTTSRTGWQLLVPWILSVPLDFRRQ